jgi:hypothetical protein
MPSLVPSASRMASPSVMPVSSTVWWKSTSRSALGVEVQVEQPVPRKQREHVVEEADAGAIFEVPSPSRSMDRSMAVSAVLRFLRAVRDDMKRGWGNQGSG